MSKTSTQCFLGWFRYGPFETEFHFAFEATGNFYLVFNEILGLMEEACNARQEIYATIDEKLSTIKIFIVS